MTRNLAVAFVLGVVIAYLLLSSDAYLVVKLLEAYR